MPSVKILKTGENQTNLNLDQNSAASTSTSKKLSKSIILTAQQVANGEPPVTTLTSFFNMRTTDDFARKILYVNIPNYYTWNASAKI